jgi:DNA-binding CsgD family transcriptional regulator
MAAARGDEVRTRALVDPLIGRGLRSGGEGRQVLALAALGRGDAQAAYRHATAVTAAGSLAPGPAALRVSMDLVEAAMRLGRAEEARRHVRAMRAAPVHAVSARFAMLTAASAALIAGPEDADAASLFEEALAAPDAERWPFDQARVQLAYGEYLRRQRRMGLSRVLLGAALDTFERLAARPWVRQAQHGLRASGVTIGRPIDPGAADLTADERTVVVLAAAGLTNKQIAARLMVSHHTVAARLYQVFPKLGVGSRAALRPAMMARDAALLSG